eukprot:scaffold107719_cov17-Tisochrysis_lutea.AAC.1
MGVNQNAVVTMLRCKSMLQAFGDPCGSGVCVCCRGQWLTLNGTFQPAATGVKSWEDNAENFVEGPGLVFPDLWGCLSTLTASGVASSNNACILQAWDLTHLIQPCWALDSALHCLTPGRSLHSPNSTQILLWFSHARTTILHRITLAVKPYACAPHAASLFTSEHLVPLVDMNLKSFFGMDILSLPGARLGLNWALQ